MKSLATFVLYVSSIAIAVGIGAWQVGNDGLHMKSVAAVTCPIVEIGESDCEQVQGESTCGYTYVTGKTFTGLESNYRDIEISQCGTYDKDGQFTRYPGCKSKSFKPTSDGCGG